MRRGGVAWLAATVIAASALAPVPPPAAAASPPAKRPVPNYDGRPEPPPDAEEILLWVPRVLLAPAYLVSEYLIRRPLGWALTEAERAGLAELLSELMGGESTYGALPTVLVDFGFRTSIGLYAYWDDAGFEGHQLRARVAFGGIDWWRGAFKQRFAWDDGRHRLGWRADYRQRPDHIHAGQGRAIDARDQGRFGLRQVEGALYYRWLPRPLSGVEAHVHVRNHKRLSVWCCGISLVDRVADGRFDAPPGLDGTSATFVTPEIVLLFDTRTELRSVGHHARAELTLSGGVDVGDADRAWAGFRLRAGGWLHLGAPDRVLGLDLTTAFVAPTGSRDVPVTWKPRLGGQDALRGFPTDLLVGDSALALNMTYRWPIWFWLDGSLHLGLGNVYGRWLEDLDPSWLRLSFGVGIETSSFDSDQVFDMMIAIGTEPFARGGEVSTVRFTVGVRDGF